MAEDDKDVPRKPREITESDIERCSDKLMCGVINIDNPIIKGDKPRTALINALYSLLASFEESSGYIEDNLSTYLLEDYGHQLRQDPVGVMKQVENDRMACIEMDNVNLIETIAFFEAIKKHYPALKELLSDTKVMRPIVETIARCYELEGDIEHLSTDEMLIIAMSSEVELTQRRHKLVQMSKASSQQHIAKIRAMPFYREKNSPDSGAPGMKL